MKHVKDRHPHLSGLDRKGPSKALLARIHRLHRRCRLTRDDPSLSDAYRDVLRNYLALVCSGATTGTRWRQVVREALSFLGSQADRHTSSLAEYDHCLYGPYLGVSDEGGAALARLPQFGVRKKNFSGGGGHKCEQIEWCENDLMRKGTCSAEQAVAGLGSGSAEWGHVFATAASDDQRRDV